MLVYLYMYMWFMINFFVLNFQTFYILVDNVDPDLAALAKEQSDQDYTVFQLFYWISTENSII